MPVLYGYDYRLKNGFNRWQGGYLDGNPDDHSVVTANYNQHTDYRVEGDGSKWRFESASGKKAMTPVLTGDIVRLSSFSRFLNTRGAGCNDNLLCVSLSDRSDTDPTSQTWRIEVTPGGAPGEPVEERVGFHLLNGWNDFGGGYLDTRGYAQGMSWAGHVPRLLAVSTAASWERDPAGTADSANWWAERP